MNPEIIDKYSENAHKANLILESGLFAEERYGMGKAQDLFLAAIGEKPVSLLTFFDPIEDKPFSDYVKPNQKNCVEINQLLSSLGLEYITVDKESSYDLIVGLDEDVVTEAKALHDENVLDEQGKMSDAFHRIGYLLGYPDSAVEAMQASQLLDFWTQLKYLREYGIKPKFNRFRFSKKHWLSEIEVMKHWFDLCEQFGLRTAE